MKINKKQKKILIIGSIIIIFMGLIPPWAEVIVWPRGIGFRKSIEYSFIFFPPENARIDFLRWLLQMITVLLAVFGFLFVFKDD